MKHCLICLLLTCLLASLLLCGCAQKDAAPDTTEATQASSTEPKSVEELCEIVQSHLERDVSELIAVIGEPNDRSYATGCGGEGEDGELYYDGFTVYTFRTDDYEIVKDVWAD